MAKQLSILPQSPISPEGLSVLDLVKQGRNPYKGMFNKWSTEDEDAVNEALESTYDLMFGTPMCIPHGRGRCLIKEAVAESQMKVAQAQ